MARDLPNRIRRWTNLRNRICRTNLKRRLCGITREESGKRKHGKGSFLLGGEYTHHVSTQLLLPLLCTNPRKNSVCEAEREPLAPPHTVRRSPKNRVLTIVSTMDALDGVPRSVLGYPVKTRTQIVMTFLVPVIFELMVYIVLTTADILVTIEHFRNGNPAWGWFTLALIWLPSLVCFCSIVSTPERWPDQIGCDKCTAVFLFNNIAILVFFPLAALYRFNRRIFWSVEALFHDKNTYGRAQSVAKIMETSPCELYHFLQAFLQAAPQMMLQLYILLRDGTFRNYDTVTAQVISVVFSFLTMATIITSFQRFESQKIVGRCYPWSTPEQATTRRKELIRSTSTADSALASHPPSIAPEADPIVPSIMRNFYSRYGGEDGRASERHTYSAVPSSPRKTLNVSAVNFDRQQSKAHHDPFVNFTDDDKLHEINVFDTVDRAVDRNAKQSGRSVSFKLRDTIDELQEMDHYLRSTEDVRNITDDSDDEYLKPDEFDAVPKKPAPPTPEASPGMFHRVSVFRNMLLFNAESFIKEKVPRLPEGMFDHADPNETVSRKVAKPDQPDGDAISLPSRRQTIVGLEQDDMVGKTVLFVGWVMFLLMRMLSLSTFYVFFPLYFWMLVANHYMLMIACIVYEVRLHEKLERYFFYFFLAYMYIFSLLEFKIRFVHVRWWYVGYVGIVLMENVAMLVVWFNLGVFESWWFYFLHHTIIVSGALTMMCFLFYYAFLRPKDKVLFRWAIGWILHETPLQMVLMEHQFTHSPLPKSGGIWKEFSGTRHE
uniref:XK-related protein n=1 Tax=Anopheles stephensi TaxID=30069 RepID=A0A182XVE3_ANOST